MESSKGYDTFPHDFLTISNGQVMITDDIRNISV